MFDDQYTPNARSVLAVALKEAQRMQHEYVGSEHILIGLASPEAGAPAKILDQFKIPLARLRTEIERLMSPGEESGPPKKLPFTPKAREILEFALDEADALGEEMIRAEHIFLALLAQDDDIAVEVLDGLGVSRPAMRDAVFKSMGKKPG